MQTYYSARKRNQAAINLLELHEDPMIVEALESYIQAGLAGDEGPFLDHDDQHLLRSIAQKSPVNSTDRIILDVKLDRIAYILKDHEPSEQEAGAWEEKVSAYENALEAYEKTKYTAFTR